MAKGRKLITQSIPAQGLASALTMTNSCRAGELVEALSSRLREVQHSNNRQTFAAGHTCRFNEQHAEGSIYGLTREPLYGQEVRLLCREHEYPSYSYRSLSFMNDQMLLS